MSRRTLGRQVIGWCLAGATIAGMTPIASAREPVVVAATPPMGWNPYNVFDLDYGEGDVMAQADLLVKLGLADRGYRYVNIDDGWWLKREGDTIRVRTSIYPSARLPDGSTSLRPFVDRLHAMGLKAGIYTDIGRNSCSQRFRPKTPNLPEGSVTEREIGTYGHHGQDAALLFAKWGFDFIKVDACGVADYDRDVPVVRDGTFRAFDPLIARGKPAQSNAGELSRQYASFAAAVRRAAGGRQPVISICAWGEADVNDWAHDHGHMWRTSYDISATWASMLANFDSAASRALFAGPGRWNDPDMLEVGNGAFDGNHLTAARAHMSLWAVLAAPLILGNDLRRMTPGIAAIIGNRDVIAVNQDPAGNQGVVVSRDGDGEVVAKALSTEGHKAVALINRGSKPLRVSASLADFGLSPTRPVAIRDLWTGARVRPVGARITVDLAPQETVLLRVEGQPLTPGVSLPADMPARFAVAEAGYKAPDRTLDRQWVLARIGFQPYGEPLMLAGRQDHEGLGVAAGSRVGVDLDGRYRRVTFDPRTLGAQPGRFEIRGDGKVLRVGTATAVATPVSIDVRGVRRIELVAPVAAAGTTAFAWHRLRFVR